MWNFISEVHLGFILSHWFILSHFFPWIKKVAKAEAWRLFDKYFLEKIAPFGLDPESKGTESPVLANTPQPETRNNVLVDYIKAYNLCFIGVNIILIVLFVHSQWPQKLTTNKFKARWREEKWKRTGRRRGKRMYELFHCRCAYQVMLMLKMRKCTY